MSKPIAISLFSGAGGLDFGFEAAGFDVAVAIEKDHDSCETYRRHSSSVVIEDSIFDVPSERILVETGLHSGEADILIAGPPCQPFSKSGYWAGGDAKRMDDPRAKTLDAFLRVLEDTQPRTFLLENVEGIGYSGKSEGLSFLLDKINAINTRKGTSYKPFSNTLNAASYGVPQFRKRFFLVAHRDGHSFSFPKETHCANNDQLMLGCDPFRTAWDAIGDVVPDRSEDLAVRGKWADLLPSVPEGGNYLWHTDRGGGLPLFGWRTRFWNFLLKLSKAAPSWTIQAQPGPATGPFHWNNRRLSMRELCRLQTFPDNIQIAGGRTSVQKQVGNAVPSLLGEVMARAIRKQLLGRRLNARLPRLLIPINKSIASKTEVLVVPRKFRELIGSHDSHPGTGLGPAALKKKREESLLS